MRLKIIRNELIKNVGKYQSCMVSNLRIIQVLHGETSWLDEFYPLEDELEWLNTGTWLPLYRTGGAKQGEQIGKLYVRLKGAFPDNR